jgi:hypothetical protein
MSQFSDNPISDVADVPKEHGHEEVMEALAKIGAKTAISVQPTRWTRTELTLPKDNSVCIIISPMGDERLLKFLDMRWWDGDGVCFFIPVFWRYAED